MLQNALLIAYGLLVAALALRVYRSASFPSGATHMSQGHHSYKYWIGRYQRRPYAAVSCSGECECLQGLSSKRYLGGEAPPLPVPSCTKSQCDCTYVHFNDRRDKFRERRRLERAGKRLEESEERRKSTGRRASDGLWPEESLLMPAR